MTVDINPIPVGHHFAITTGQYSDFSLQGLYVARAVIDVDAELAAYIAAFPDRARDIKPHLFLAWLYGRSLLTKIDCFELHFGGYDGNPDDVNVSEI